MAFYFVIERSVVYDIPKFSLGGAVRMLKSPKEFDRSEFNHE